MIAGFAQVIYGDNVMIRTLEIKNYRTFADFKLQDAARVNLLVGTNNSGKSSLLEAIYLLTGESPLANLRYILNERGEVALRMSDLCSSISASSERSSRSSAWPLNSTGSC